jgi:hypothetical protein
MRSPEHVAQQQASCIYLVVVLVAYIWSGLECRSKWRPSDLIKAPAIAGQLTLLLGLNFARTLVQPCTLTE